MEEKSERLPDAELEVMLALWEAGKPLKTSAILERLKEKKNWSMSTLQSLLTRLDERGFVSITKQMRFKYYAPKITEEAYRQRETQSFLERLHGNSYQSLLATLVNNHTITEQNIDEIAELIRKAGKE